MASDLKIRAFDIQRRILKLRKQRDAALVAQREAKETLEASSAKHMRNAWVSLHGDTERLRCLEELHQWITSDEWRVDDGTFVSFVSNPYQAHERQTIDARSAVSWLSSGILQTLNMHLTINPNHQPQQPLDSKYIITGKFRNYEEMLSKVESELEAARTKVDVGLESVSDAMSRDKTASRLRVATADAEVSRLDVEISKLDTELEAVTQRISELEDYDDDSASGYELLLRSQSIASSTM